MTETWYKLWVRDWMVGCQTFRKWRYGGRCPFGCFFFLFCSLYLITSLDLGPLQMALAQDCTTSRDKSSGGGVSPWAGSAEQLSYGTDRLSVLWVRTIAYVKWWFDCFHSYSCMGLYSPRGLHLMRRITERHGCTWRVHGRVTPALYSRLPKSLRFLAIIIPFYYSTISTSTCATVSTDIPSYEAIHGRMSLHLHCQDHPLNPQCSFTFRSASLPDRPPPSRTTWELKAKVTSSHSHGWELSISWMESLQPARLRMTASKCLSNLARSRPPNSHHHGVQVHHRTHSITASQCISTLAWPWPQSASLSSLDNSLQVYLQTRSIMASQYAWLQPPSSHDHGLQVHLQTRSTTPSKSISDFTRSSRSGTPQIALKHCPQIVLETGRGHQTAVRGWTGNSFCFCSRPVRKPDRLWFGGVVTQTGH